jgi:hypothetical protein
MRVTAFAAGTSMENTETSGLTWYITTKNQKVLIVPYDSENFWKYANLKETAVGEIDKIFLLQGCRDSIRELEHFLKNNSKAEIYLPRKNNERYLNSLYNKSQAYAKNDRMKEWRARIKFVDDFSNIDEGIQIVYDDTHASPVDEPKECGTPCSGRQDIIMKENGMNALFVNDRQTAAEYAQNQAESEGEGYFSYLFYCGDKKNCIKKNCITCELTEMQNGQTEVIETKSI